MASFVLGMVWPHLYCELCGLICIGYGVASFVLGIVRPHLYWEWCGLICIVNCVASFVCSLKKDVTKTL